MANPIVQRQWKRLWRRGPLFWGLVLVLWVGLSWLWRMKFWDLLPLSILSHEWLGVLLHGLLNLTLRADIPVAFLLFFGLFPWREWRATREELATIPMPPEQIVFSRFWVPVIVLIVLNTLAAPWFYHGLYESSSVLMIADWQRLLYACVLGFMAWIEDVLFCIIAVLLMLKETIDPKVRVEKAILNVAVVLLLIGFLLTLLFMAQGYLALHAQALLRTSFFSAMIFWDGAAMLAIWLIEASAIWFLYRACLRRARSWAMEE